MIKVKIYDPENTLEVLELIHKLSLDLINNNMNLKFCQQHSDACSECDIKDFCYECEEIEVWSKNYSVKLETEES